MHKYLDEISDGLKDEFPLTSQYVKGIYGLAKKLSYQMSTNKAVDTHADFFQVMLVETCKLEPKFDKERGNSFYTFINRPLRALVFKQFVVVDTSTKHYKDIKTFVRAYEQEHHLYPTIETISDGVELPEQTVKLEFYGRADETYISDDSELFDSVEVTEPTPMDYLGVLDPLETMVIELMYSEIPEELAATFTMHYLSLSKNALDDIHASALAKLREAMEDD